MENQTHLYLCRRHTYGRECQSKIGVSIHPHRRARRIGNRYHGPLSLFRTWPAPLGRKELLMAEPEKVEAFVEGRIRDRGWYKK